MKNAKKKTALLLTVLLLVAALTPAASAAGTGCRTPICQLRNTILCRFFGQCPAVQPPADPPVQTLPAVPEKAPAEPETPEMPPATDPVHAYELRAVELVNAQRARYGLAPLTADDSLCEKARLKSQDMARSHYFNHNSPSYDSPFDMMRALGIRYRYAGENIAMGFSSPEAVVSAWMNSESHRANILSANYTSIGIGYAADGGYWTQWFIG